MNKKKSRYVGFEEIAIERSAHKHIHCLLTHVYKSNNMNKYETQGKWPLWNRKIWLFILHNIILTFEIIRIAL